MVDPQEIKANITYWRRLTSDYRDRIALVEAGAKDRRSLAELKTALAKADGIAAEWFDAWCESKKESSDAN